MRFRFTLILSSAIGSAAIGLIPSPALAEWSDLAPRPFENGGSVELFGSYERDSQVNGDRPFRWNDIFFRQKVTLFSNGYFYHPKFLQYQLSVSGALKEENFSPSYAESTGWQTRTGLEYTGRLYFLPEHPYNLELFALRYEPLYKEQSTTRYDGVETSNGVQFRYRKKPWFFHAGYLDNTTSSQSSSSNVKRLALEGEYFKRLVSGKEFSATAFYTPSQFTGDLGLEGNTDQYGVSGLVNLRWLRFHVLASDNLYDQESRLSGRTETDQFSLQSRLGIYGPGKLRTDLYHRLIENRTSVTDPGASRSRELSDDNEDFQAIVSHRLYESLDSRYIYLQTDRTSSGGESSSVSHSVGVDYSKLIPRGRLLAGINLSTSSADNRGQADISNEPYPATPVPGTFTLAQPDIERNTLDLFLRSPLPPFQLIRLVENVHYSVAPVGNRLQIQVFSLPPQFIVPGTYDLFASYSLVTGVFELKTDTYGFNTSVQVLDNLLTPYYSYLAVRSDVVDGVFPGVPVDSTTNTVGLTLQDGPWRALAEYQDLDWEVSPSQTWRTEVQYVESVDPTLRVYATASWLDRYYGNGTSPGSPGSYAERNAILSSSVQKDFLERTLMLSASGSFSHLFGQVDSNAYSLSGAVTWTIGKLDLNAGFNAYGASTHGTVPTPFDRDHQYVFFKIVRRFF